MLSIIIIAKNEEKLLPRLLRSIRRQDYTDYEVILADAKSTDKTRVIARQHGCRIVDGGLPSKGRNNGAKAAKGDVLLFLDADVVLPDHFLSSNMRAFSRYDVGTPRYVPHSKDPIDHVFYFLYHVWVWTFALFNIPHAGGFCIFCRRSLWKSVTFPEDVHYSEDMAFVLRCVKKGGRFGLLGGVPICVSVRRFHKDGRLRTGLRYLYYGIYRLIYGDQHKAPFEYQLHGGSNVGKEGSKARGTDAGSDRRTRASKKNKIFLRK